MDTQVAQPKSPPPSQQPQQLPHLIVDEPKRSPWTVVAIIILSIMVLAIPLGLFLLQQRTNLAPQAAVIEPVQEPAAGIILESKFSPESKGGIIPVDIYVKSSRDAINLARVNLKFEPLLLGVENIATDSASLQKSGVFNKWLEVSNDNSLGSITIIAGLPSPGLKTTDLEEGKAYLATINLRPKAAGSAVLQAQSDSLFLRNLDNRSVFLSGRDLVINLSGAVAQPIAQSTKPVNPATQPAIVITSPEASANYSYFKPIDIVWSAFNIETISRINLYVNGAIFGSIAQNLDEEEGKFTWNPQETLSLPYIQLSNTFMIEVVGIGKAGENIKAITGPFGILGQEEVGGIPPNPDVFLVNPLSIDDASRLLSNYLILPLQDKSLDFNRDEVINELDFYLLRMNLAGRGIIK